MNLVTFNPFFPSFLRTENLKFTFFLKINFTSFLPVKKMLKSMHAHGLWYPAAKCHSFLTREWTMNHFTGMLNLSYARHLWHKNKSEQTEACVGLFAREKKWVGLFVSETRKWKWWSSIAKPFCCTHSCVDSKIVAYVVPPFTDK
jgi:hypothetical protein